MSFSCSSKNNSIKQLFSFRYLYTCLFFFGCLSSLFAQVDSMNIILDQVIANRVSIKGRNPVHNFQLYFNYQHKYIYNQIAKSSDKSVHVNLNYKSASIAKSFIAVMVLQLEEEGLLNIDSSVTQYLNANETKNILVCNGKDISSNITIKSLLNHTTGIKDYILDDNRFLFMLNLFPRKSYPVEDHLERYKRHKLNKIDSSSVGKFYYSDTNYLLLAMIIERVTKQSIQKNLDKRISSKLNLKNTYVDNWNIPYSNMLPQYIHRRKITNILHPSFEFGGGGFITTTEDLVNFITGLFQNKLFTHKTTLEKMIKSNNTDYTLGLMIKRIPNTWIDSAKKDTLIAYGHESFFGTEMYHIPTHDITWVINKNQAYNNKNTKHFPAWLIAMRLCRRKFE